MIIMTYPKATTVKFFIELTQNENVEQQTTSYKVEFSHLELAEMGPPPQRFMFNVEDETYIFDPEVNPRACDTVEYKLMQLAWMALSGPRITDRGRYVMDPSGDPMDFP